MATLSSSLTRAQLLLLVNKGNKQVRKRDREREREREKEREREREREREKEREGREKTAAVRRSERAV
jgi:hypothetical protein